MSVEKRQEEKHWLTRTLVNWLEFTLNTIKGEGECIQGFGGPKVFEKTNYKGDVGCFLCYFGFYWGLFTFVMFVTGWNGRHGVIPQCSGQPFFKKILFCFVWNIYMRVRPLLCFTEWSELYFMVTQWCKAHHFMLPQIQEYLLSVKWKCSPRRPSVITMILITMPIRNQMFQKHSSLAQF